MSGPPSALRVPSRSSGAAGGDSGHGSRSSSLKKSGQSGSSSSSGSQKKKAARAWDDSIHDLSVHKLPKQKQMEKQLKRLSRQQLGQIAAMPMPPNRQAAVARAVDALSPTHSDRHTHQQQPRRQRDSSSSRRSNSQARVRSGSRSRSRSPSASSFSSPQHETGEWDGSSVGSTPESHSSSAEDNESAVSTPSPHQQRASRQQPLQQQRPAALVHSAKPQVPRQNRPVNKEQQAQAQMQPAPLGHAPLSRHVAAPVVTSAPPSQENSDDETGDDSFSAFAPAGGSASTATLANYSPWLKPNHMLSPVLERSISDSAASTPNAHAQQHQQQQQQHQLQQHQLQQLRSVQEESASARYSQIDQLQPQSQGLDRPFFTDSDSNAPSNSHSPARPAERRSVAQQPTEQNDGSSRNLLADLRHSLDAPLHDSNVAQQGSTLASMPLPTLQHFLSLMSTLASHLSEREAVAAKEAQFKTSTVASLSGCSAQLKALTARLDEVERENRAMKAAALQQSLEHEKSLHAVQQQVRTLEQRLEQMALAPQQQAQTKLMQLHGQPSAPTHAYNPTLYHSQHLSHSALPTPALSHPSSSSIYSMHAPAQGQQQSQQHLTANRAPSPPRPIVINHSTNAATVAAPGRGYAAQQHQQQQQQQQQHHSSSQQSPALPSFGSRLSEVNVHVADGFRASTQQMAMGPRPAVSASAVPPTHKLAWQAAKSAQQQQQQQQQQALSQSQMRPQTAPQGAMRQPSAQQLQQQQQPQQQQHQHQPAPASRFHSTLSNAAAHDLDGSDDFDDEAPRERMATAAHAARFAPFSPGSEQDEEEARQFAQQAAKMRAQTVAFGAIQGRQPQQQPHQQQQHQQR